VYDKIIEDIQNKISDIDKKIKELQKEKEVYLNFIKSVRDMKAIEDRKAGRLAVQKGICPFPDSCNQRNYCTADHCNADACSNGYAYRTS